MSNEATPMKKGRMSKEEIEYLRDNAGNKSPAEMATKLGRTLETVVQWLHANLPQGGAVPHKALPNDRGSISEQLRRSTLWTRLKKEFDDEELEHFSDRYSAYMQQFRSDVLATEIDQIVNYIRTDILMGRNMEARKSNIAMLQRFEEELRAIPVSQKKDSKRAVQLEDLISTYKNADAARSKEYIELQNAHSKAAEKLKATRDQRITKIDSMKVSFLDIIKELGDAPNREKVGKEMETFRHIVYKEMNRLATPHKFEDGRWDLPILNADTFGLAGELPNDEPESPPPEGEAQIADESSSLRDERAESGDVSE